MLRVNRKITIDAPVEKVFAFLEDKSHLPEIWPSMIEVSDEQALPNGGKSYHWLYKMAGIKFRGTTEERDFVRNRRIGGTSEAAIRNTVTWTFDQRGGATDVTFDAAYEVPGKLIGRIAEPLLARMNEGEANLVLENLKTRLES